MAKSTRPDPANVKLLIALATYRTVEIKCMQSIFDALSSLPYQSGIISHGTANVPTARNELSKRFLESEADYMLFVDHDQVFAPEHVKMLVDVMLEDEDREIGLVGGHYIKRDGSMTPLVGQFQEGTNEMPPIDEHIKWLMENRGEVVDSDVIPTGFMLIRREVFEQMDPPFFYLDWPDRKKGDDQVWSSDTVFVQNVKNELGMATKCHLGVEVGHIGQMIFHPNHFFQNAGRLSTQGQLQRIKAEAGRAFGYNTKEYWDKIWATEEELGIERNYSVLYEAIIEAARPLAEETPPLVMDLASGPGQLADALKEQLNARVHCYDISEWAVEKCEERGHKAEVFDVSEDRLLPGKHGRYDMVVCTELLEHLEEPMDAVRTAYSALADGGLAIFTCPADCMPPEEEPEHVRTVSEEDLRDWLSHYENFELMQIGPYWLAAATKPPKE